MKTVIFIAEWRGAGFVPVSVNGKVTRVPVGRPTMQPAEILDALANASVAFKVIPDQEDASAAPAPQPMESQSPPAPEPAPADDVQPVGNEPAPSETPSQDDPANTSQTEPPVETEPSGS